MSAEVAQIAEAAVIDASVGLKWVLPEADSEEAISLRDRLVASGTAVHVPDLFWAEAANVLWRLTRRGEEGFGYAEARGILEALRAAPLRTEAVGPVAGRALEIAAETGATVYDAVYLAVAELRGALLWTADRRLLGAMAGSAWESRVTGLGESP